LFPPFTEREDEEMITALMSIAPTRKDAPDATFSRSAAELRPLVRAVVAAMLRESREHPDVEDCTHEALRRALEGRSRLREGEPLRPWVMGIARHVALDTLRARKRARLRDARGPAADDAGETADALERVADPAPAADDRLARAEQGREIARALGALPEGQRKALFLFHSEGLQYHEIATRLGVPLGTVATWVTRARKSVAAVVQREHARAGGQEQ
jgi:RNA polymerase sigma-70 factor, ECF subfamily